MGEAQIRRVRTTRIQPRQAGAIGKRFYDKLMLRYNRAENRTRSSPIFRREGRTDERAKGRLFWEEPKVTSFGESQRSPVLRRAKSLVCFGCSQQSLTDDRAKGYLFFFEEGHQRNQTDEEAKGTGPLNFRKTRVFTIVDTYSKTLLKMGGLVSGV